MIQQNKIAANRQTLLSGKSNSTEKRAIDIDKAILVSDLHLGYEKCNVAAFTDFLEDFLQTAEQRQGMDAIDKFAKSKAKYPLLGMQLDDILIFGHTHRPSIDIENSVINTGAWTRDMLIPEWFEEEYGFDKACSGWYVEINNGEYQLVPYGIRPKTKEDKKNFESNRDRNENVVSKAASQIGDVVKQMVEGPSSVIKHNAAQIEDKV